MYGSDSSSKAALDQVPKFKESSTITDLCCSDDLPEVEIVSLVQESIPRYTLRADTLTQFAGYEHEDWFVPHPALPEDSFDITVTPQVARETLNYMVLSGKRVSQMTRTYNDIEAVTRLLEEKEKDLELTARIGQELLTHNNQLEAQVAALESQLKEEQDRLVQTQHELAKKTELLAVLAAEDDTSDPNTPTAGKCITLEILQRKVASLEVQNGLLKEEARQLAAETTACEEKENQLVKDVAQQLELTNKERSSLCEELSRLKEENRQQHEELATRTARLNLLESSNQELAADNVFITSQLNTTKQTQELLCTEILELKEQYAQMLGLLNDAQEQLRKYKKKQVPCARLGPNINTNLNTELESSLLSDSSLDSGVGIDKQVPSYRRVFETVRSASRASSGGGSSNASPALRMFGTTNSTMLTSATSSGPKMSSCFSSMSSGSWRPPLQSQQNVIMTSSLGHSSLESQPCLSLSEEMGLAGPSYGVPGQPGSLDLEIALGRLSAPEIVRRRQHMSNEFDIDNYSCRTPDSIMSTGSSSGLSGASWKLPEKLQIVKPMEGSLTLHQWSQLARPNLGSALSERPCVVARGQSTTTEDNPTQYSLDDVEEDDWETSHPGKQFESSGHTFTFTNSTVLHPEDLTQVTCSYRGLQVSTTSPCHNAPSSPPNPATPRNMSRRNSTSTFSTSLGLAKMLNERGITAATSTPSISACATPCNSPERPSSPVRTEAPRLGFFASGAEILRRTLVGDPKPRKSTRKTQPAHKGLSNIRLVDKIEEVGLDTILRPPEGGNFLRSVGPMSQLAGRRLSRSSTSSNESSSQDETKSRGRGRKAGSQQRRDLGTVKPRVTSNSDAGTVNCLLFGRKGGLF